MNGKNEFKYKINADKLEEKIQIANNQQVSRFGNRNLKERLEHLSSLSKDKKQDDLINIMVRDNQVVRKLGWTHQDLANLFLKTDNSDFTFETLELVPPCKSPFGFTHSSLVKVINITTKKRVGHTLCPSVRNSKIWILWRI